MVSEVKSNIVSIKAACRSTSVKRLALFGSAARGTDFNSGSDIDFLVEFFTGEDGMPLVRDCYFRLLESLEKITNRKVDLVSKDRIRNRFFQESIEAELIPIYEG